jgi:hypothetical protein
VIRDRPGSAPRERPLGTVVVVAAATLVQLVEGVEIDADARASRRASQRENGSGHPVQEEIVIVDDARLDDGGCTVIDAATGSSCSACCQSAWPSLHQGLGRLPRLRPDGAHRGNRQARRRDAAPVANVSLWRVADEEIGACP